MPDMPAGQSVGGQDGLEGSGPGRGMMCSNQYDQYCYDWEQPITHKWGL